MIQNKKNGILPQMPLAKLFSFFLLLIPFLLSGNFSFSQVQTQKAVYSKMDTYVNGYYESLPVDYSSNTTKKYPLLIFIHGVGEIGNGGSQLPLVLRNGPPKLLNQGIFPSSFTVGGKSHSFIVISPQLTDNNYSGAATIINNVINYCKQKYRVDESRIYLTGLSMGGTMTWRFGGDSKTNADRLAASLIVCGSVSSTLTRVANTATSKLPVWAAVNSGDPVMSASATTATIAAINAFIPTPPKALLTVFPVSGHDAWTKTYDPNFRQGNLNVYEWMLSYARGTVSEPIPAPALPVSKAGSNQAITLPASSVTVDGSGSTFPTGTTFLWKKIQGPSAGIITTPSSLKTTITGLSIAGDYQFQLQLTDSKGNISTSSMHVIVNAAPGGTIPLYSNAGGNLTITLPTSSVTVDGNIKSTYPTGSQFWWSMISGPSTSSITSPGWLKTTITGLKAAGDYSFQLLIKDSKGNTATSTMHVFVNAAASSILLKSNAGANQTIYLPTSSVTVDGSKSTLPTGTTILWRKVGGPAGGTITNPTSLKPTISGLSTAGDYQFQLSLTDSKGASSTSSMHVIVKSSVSGKGSSSATPLYSNAGSNQIITLPTSSVSLDGYFRSTFSTGTTFLWKKVGGPAGGKIANPTSLKTTVSGLSTAGDYQFQLRLTDSKGNLETSSMHVIVRSPVSPRAISALDAGATASVSLGIADLSATEQLAIKINPNPVKSDMTVWINGKATGRTSVIVYNLQGQVLLQQMFAKDVSGSVNRTVNISKLPAGIYFVQVMIDNKYKQVSRVVKQ